MPTRIEDVLYLVKKNNPQANLNLIKKAYSFAKEVHQTQKRLTKEPYIIHPLATAYKLAELKMDDLTVAAGLLHDTIEDTGRNINEIKEKFGEEIAFLIEGVTKLGRLKYRGMERYIENLRRMFVAMAQDIRVIVIKFADRIHNLETLTAQPKNKQKRIALESLEIFAPIANRLGMGEIKGILEDLSFPYIYPKEYEKLLKLVKPKYVEREKIIEGLKKDLTKILRDHQIKIVSIHGRVKHLFSLYKKLLTYNNDLSKIYDLVALRIVVPDINQCYEALGVIHRFCRPLKGRIKDYIAQPKPNGYRSLHTTVFTPRGEIIEIQIRDSRMHEEAEYGIASHWHYKEKEGEKLKDKELPWVQELVRFQKEVQDGQEYLASLKLDMFQNRIFTFTPHGDVIDLPEDATPVDFAYYIHTEVGHRCSGAFINDQIASLNTKLKSGDVVEIITDPKRKGPNPDWLDFVKTSTARRHIRDWITKNRWSFLRRLFKSEKTSNKSS